MSVATTSLSDSLPSSIPKLDASGINWVIFSLHFHDAVEAKGFWGHLDGTSTRPINSTIPGTMTPGGSVATAEKPAMTPEELAGAQSQWVKDGRSAKSLLTQKIRDSTLIRIHSKKSVKERWDAIVAEFMEKGAYAQTDLRTKFLESKCPDKGNVHEFLDSLRVKREELASVVEIDEKDYQSTIIGSLPFHPANFSSAQLTAARIASITLTPDALIAILVEEYDCQILQRARWFGTRKAKDNKDEAWLLAPALRNGRVVKVARSSVANAGTAVRRSTSRTNALNPLSPRTGQRRRRQRPTHQRRLAAAPTLQTFQHTDVRIF